MGGAAILPSVGEADVVFIIFSGWGILVIPIVMATAVAVGALLLTLLNAIGYPQLAFLAFSIGLFTAAAVNWVVRRHLNSQPGRELMDVKTGERLVLQRSHRLFWIKMEYWSVPVALAGLVPLLALRNLGS